MDVVVLATQKGGSGKTTLAAHLAVQAERAGDGPVWIIDADPQGTLARWWNKRPEDVPPQLAQLGETNLRQTLNSLEGQGARIVIIDTPGRIDAAIGSIIGCADLVIVPVIPSINDLEAIWPTLTAIEKHGVPKVFVRNNVNDKKLTGSAAVALSQHGTVSPVTCKTRQAYRSSMTDGQTVMEIGREGASAAEEIGELWPYIKQQLGKGRHHGQRRR